MNCATGVRRRSLRSASSISLFLGVICAGGSVSGGPEEGSLIKAWCAPFVAAEGVDVTWGYFTPVGITGSGEHLHRERVIACWGVGLVVESGGAIGRRPGDFLPPDELPADPARLVHVDRNGTRTDLSWRPGSAAHPGLRQAESDFYLEWSHRVFLSEYLVATHLYYRVPSSVLESAVWEDAPSGSFLRLSTDRHDFEWRRGQDEILLTQISFKDHRGSSTFRQEFGGHRIEPSIGCSIATERRMLLPDEESSDQFIHVNTAEAEGVLFLAEMPADQLELDTSRAMRLDLARGVAVDAEGNVIGRIMQTSRGGKWRTLLLMAGVVGVGVASGIACWWWMRKGSQA